MGIIHLRLPDDLQAIIDQRVASGRVKNADAYLVEAARRFAEELEAEEEVVSEAAAGVAEAEAGHFVTIATPKDAEDWHQRTMARLRDQLAADTR